MDGRNKKGMEEKEGGFGKKVECLKTKSENYEKREKERKKEERREKKEKGLREEG